MDSHKHGVNMLAGGWLIIDDVSDALEKMSDLGRQIASEPTEAIRSAVRDYALRRRWHIVAHCDFVTWAAEAISPSDLAWLNLDPLFSPTAAHDRVHHVRMTRRFSGNQTFVSRNNVFNTSVTDSQIPALSGEVGLIDDAAASGLTLKRMAREVQRQGAAVSRVLVAASSRMAHDSFRAAVPTLRWSTFVKGDWQVIHLRDGCPHLPYSGRPTPQPPIPSMKGAPIEVRVPTSMVAGSPWQAMMIDTSIQAAVTAARSAIAYGLGQALCRPATVRDLDSLGQSVPALSNGDQVLTGEEILTTLALQ